MAVAAAVVVDAGAAAGAAADAVAVVAAADAAAVAAADAAAARADWARVESACVRPAGITSRTSRASHAGRRPAPTAGRR